MDEQIDVEHALRDVMHIVCEYVDSKDLTAVAEVCKSWNLAALREINKRFYVERLRLPYKTDNVVGMLNRIPYASLLTYETKFDKSLSLPEGSDKPSIDLKKELLKDFKKQLPNKTIVFNVDEYLTTEDSDFQDTDKPCDLKSTGSHDILGLFLPAAGRQVRLHVASVSTSEIHHKSFSPGALVDRLAESLGFNDCEHPKSTILMFTKINFADYRKNRLVIGDLYRRVRQKGKEVTLACFSGLELEAGNCNDETDESNSHTLVLLKISGPSTESWSTFIHYRAGLEEIERKLHELKHKIKRKRHYIGLVYSLTCAEPKCEHIGHPCGRSREIMRNLKSVFPHIPFVGFFVFTTKHFYSQNVHHFNFANLEEVFDDLLFFVTWTVQTAITIISYD